MKHDHVATVAAAGAAIGRSCRAAPAAPVRTCPEWTGADLLVHVCAFAVWVRDLHAGRHDLSVDVPVLTPAEADERWDDELAALVELFRTTPPGAVVPNWSVAPDDAAFWSRRAALALAVHAVDAATLTTEADAPLADVPADVALDGIAEYLDVFVETALASGQAPAADATLRLEVLDVDGDVSGVTGRDLPRPGPVTTLRGTASRLYLGLWKRVDPLELFVSGDRERVAHWPTI